MRTLRLGACCALLILSAGTLALAQLASGPVVVVPIHGTIDDTTSHLLQRSIAEANRQHAAAIVLDVDSAGGLDAPAMRMRDAIFAANEPVDAYVSRRAYATAALVTLAASHIAMASDASIGAAQPVPATAKNVSALRAEFESTATRNHRDAQIAGAMVDENVDLPQYKPAGSTLTLDASDAVRAGFADFVAPTLSDAMDRFGLGSNGRVVETYTLGERLARVATSPVASVVLLVVGLLGMLIEMQTLHGVAGAIGLGALALFFGAHVYAGFSNGLVIALAVLGLFGILWELHVVPGHGLPGVFGVLALLVAALLAFGLPFLFVGVELLATAVVVSVIAYTFFVRAVPENAWAHRLALAAAQGPDYVSSADHRSLQGAVGTAATYLRPAGIAAIDGKRVDVLTKGEFIARGTPVRVVRVEGARVFVEAIDLPSYRL